MITLLTSEGKLKNANEKGKGNENKRFSEREEGEGRREARGKSDSIEGNNIIAVINLEVEIMKEKVKNEENQIGLCSICTLLRTQNRWLILGSLC